VLKGEDFLYEVLHREGRGKNRQDTFLAPFCQKGEGGLVYYDPFVGRREGGRGGRERFFSLDQPVDRKKVKPQVLFFLSREKKKKERSRGTR